jgi:hypothetical protein
MAKRKTRKSLAPAVARRGTRTPDEFMNALRCVEEVEKILKKALRRGRARTTVRKK